MTNRLLIAAAVAIGMLLGQNAFAQKSHVDDISIDARATFHQQTMAGDYSTHFQGDYFNVHIAGHLTDNISFRVRQRMNKEIDVENPFNATDFLWLKWQATDKLGFTFGKQAIMLGGYEIDSAPIDVYYYSAFCSHLYQYYAFGATATYSFAPGQDLSLQFAPSPISSGLQDAYSYNAYWHGHIVPLWETLWSFNIVEDEFHRKMNYIILGNKFYFGPLVVDIDLMNRAAIGQPRYFFTDWTVICKAIYTVGKWNFCTKFGYETNSAENVDENGFSYNTALPAGNNYVYGGCGVEYFPLDDDNLRLHAVYFRDNHDRINNYDIGVTWRFKIYSRE